MHIGQWLIAGSGETIKVFSPWFPRGADNVICTYEQIYSISGSLVVKVVEKNLEDTGNGSVITPVGGSWSQVGSTSFYTARFAPMEQLVRFQYEVFGEEATAMVLYRMLSPTWFDTAHTA